MTTPNIDTADEVVEQPTPVTPEVHEDYDAADDEGLDLAAMAAEIAGHTPKAKDEGEPGEPAADRGDGRNDKGQFVAKEGEAKPDAAPVVPDAKADEAAKADAVKRPAPFVAKQGADEVEIPDDVAITFTASNGKEYTKPVSGLVELAKHGIYNHELQQEVKQTRAELAQANALRDQITQYEQWAREIQQERARLLTDMDYLAEQMARHEQENTPEARAKRAEEALETERAQRAGAEQRMRAETFLSTTVQPALESLIQQYHTVTFPELYGQFALLTEPLKVRGVIPPDRLEHVATIVQSHLAPWMAQMHATRTEDATTRAAHEKAAAEAAKAAQDAAAAKREAEALRKQTLTLRKQVDRAIAPTGARASLAEPTRNAPPKNWREAGESALERALKKSGVA